MQKILSIKHQKFPSPSHKKSRDLKIRIRHSSSRKGATYQVQRYTSARQTHTRLRSPSASTTSRDPLYRPKYGTTGRSDSSFDRQSSRRSTEGPLRRLVGITRGPCNYLSVQPNISKVKLTSPQTRRTTRTYKHPRRLTN